MSALSIFVFTTPIWPLFVLRSLHGNSRTASQHRVWYTLIKYPYPRFKHSIDDINYYIMHRI